MATMGQHCRTEGTQALDRDDREAGITRRAVDSTKIDKMEVRPEKLRPERDRRAVGVAEWRRTELQPKQ